MTRDRFDESRGGRGRHPGTPAARNGGWADERRVLRDRARIAQTAARLIAEHGITDWSLAKRKAARHLMLPDATPLPSNDDIERALSDHHALFGGPAHAACLRRQRTEALSWMQRLARWDPLLVGGVAAGWATEHSDVRLELVADDPKAVEIELASAGVVYAASPPADNADRQQGLTQLRIMTRDAAIRLSILIPAQRRNRPRKDDEPRLSATAVAALLDGA
jgi:hypothetical protein